MLTVELRTWFTVDNSEEAERLLDALIDADLAIVCNPADASWQPCSTCLGTLVNVDDPAFPWCEDDGDEYRPGAPCAQCLDGERPGFELTCVRPHASSASVRDAGTLDGEDERLRARLRELHAVLAEEPGAALALVTSWLADLDALERDFQES